MSEQTHSPEHQSHTSYQILTTDNYLHVITDRQGVKPTETMERGDSEGMRASYIKNTEKLIDTIRHGFSTETAAEHDNADIVFYLDKSARPVAWLTDSFWDVFADRGNIPPKPATKFINLHAQEGPGGSRPDPSDIAQQVKDGDYDTYIDSMREVFADMAGKNILVVDEVSVSGSTQELAYQIFQRAFPESHIRSIAWMQAGKRQDKQGNTFPVEIPVWYKKDSSAGRGVTDVDAQQSALSPSSAQRLGADILSTTPDEPDLEAVQLRREIKQLAIDVKVGRQPIIPARDIDDSRYDNLTFRQVKDQPTKRSLFS